MNCMDTKIYYEFVNYIEYHGGAIEVLKYINCCSQCGAKFLLSHMVDYKNYFVQETSRCLDCGSGTKQVVHPLH